MKFYDAHVHNKGQESGGFLVGLEGAPWFDGILYNEEAEKIARANSAYRFFHYVVREKMFDCSDCAIVRLKDYGQLLLKYHPRREKYSPEEMIESIRKLQPRAVMIDTLNEPFWTPYDYWKVARTFPEIPVFLPHAGGYLINDFIKICHFQPNVWIDFALTHTNFGSISTNPLPYVDQAIVYALNSPFRNRVLMGSDLPFFDQLKVVGYYQRLDALEILNGNFERVFELLG